MEMHPAVEKANLAFYQPRSGIVMQNCRLKKNKEKKGLMGFLVCLVVDFQYFQLFSFFS